jgi:hypothetical protein
VGGSSREARAEAITRQVKKCTAPYEAYPAQQVRDALQIRDRLKRRVFDDPGSAVHRSRAAPRPGNVGQS